MKSQSYGRWSAEELCGAADIAKEKGVGIRLQADGSISIGIVPPPFPTSERDAAGKDSATEMPRVFSPATLAQRWICSEQHIRNMVAAGKLGSFNVGEKLLRISREEVERVENLISNSIEAPAQGAFDADLVSEPAGEKRERAKRLDDPVMRARWKRQAEAKKPK